MKLLTVVAAAVLATTAPGQAETTQSSGELFLTSAIRLDRATGNITLPLYEGRHDGSPVWYIVTESSDPTGLPPAQFQAGAVGDADYSPLITLGDGVVMNASQLANASGLHDAVVSIDYDRRQVTLISIRKPRSNWLRPSRGRHGRRT